jgi:hypothetical protein
MGMGIEPLHRCLFPGKGGGRGHAARNRSARGRVFPQTIRGLASILEEKGAG